MSTHHTGAGADGPSLRQDALPLLLLLVLGAAFLFELLTMSGVPFVRDIQLFFLPHKRMLWEALQSGEIPFWTSLIGTGSPVMANFQSGVFYPPHWLFAITPFLVGFNWLIAVHLLLGGAGTYLLCRHLDFSRAASWIAAASFMLGGYFVSLTNLVNALQTAAWAPLMALTLVRHVRRPGPGRFGLVVGVHLIAFLAGAPYTFILGAAMSGGLVLVWSWEELRQSAWRTTLLTLGAAAVAAAGIAAVQILPTMEMASESTRAGGLMFEEAAHYSIDPLQLLHLVFPNDFSDPTYEYGHRLQFDEMTPWLYSLYLGVVPLVLALFSAGAPDRRKVVVFWATLAALGIVLGLGRHTPVFGLVRQHVPGLDSFRFPEKFFLLTGFSVPMLAAHGYSALEREREGRGESRALLAAAAAALLTVGVDLFWRFGETTAKSFITSAFAGSPVADNAAFAYRTWMTGIDEMTFLMVSAVVLIALYRRGVLRSTLFAGLVVLLVGTDFWLAHRHLIPLVDPSFYRQSPTVTRALPVEQVRTTYRYWATPFDENAGAYYRFGELGISVQKWMFQQTIQPSSGPMHDVLTLDSSDAIHLRRVKQRKELLRELSEPWRWRLLEVSSARYLYSPLELAPAYHAGRTPLDSIPGYVYELAHPVPRAYVGKGTFHASDRAALRVTIDPARRGHPPVEFVGDSAARPPADLRRWAEGTAGFELAVADSVGSTGALRSPPQDAIADSLVLPESGSATADAGPAVNSLPERDLGTAAIISDTGEEVRIRVAPAEAGFLVLTDTGYPGWRVRVDGERRPLLDANYFFRAVPVRPGDEEVVFRYRSAPYRQGRLVSGASVLVLLAGLLGWRWWRARNADSKGT